MTTHAGPSDREQRLREALLESLAVSRGGGPMRTIVLALCTAPAILILGQPFLFVWLAALLIWNAFLVPWLERHWVVPALERDLHGARLRRASMVLFGFSFTQVLPLAGWSTGAVFGAAIGATWVISSATQLFIYYSRDRWLLTAGLAPVVACALVGPTLASGFGAESVVTSMFVLFGFATGGAMIGNSDKLIARAADESAARRSAEAASRAKTRFIAGIHHELRTPLNAIIGYSEMLRESAQDDGRGGDVADLDRVIAAARLQLMLMNDLMTFAELQDGRVELEFDEFDAGVLANEAAQALRGELCANGNAFTLKLGDDLAGAHSDPAKIRHCLEQLLSNAAKFTRDGVIALTAHRERGPAGDWLVFSVSDSGVGIAAERLTKIFEPLAHTEDSAARPTGAGVGLAITARLARLLGGAVSVASAPGQGSTFTLRVRGDLRSVSETMQMRALAG